MSLQGDRVSAEEDRQVVTKIQQLLDSGSAVEAARLASSSLEEIAREPRIALRVLEALGKKRHDAELLALIGNIEGLNILKLESLIFALRAKFRMGDYSVALRLINRILEMSDRNVEALRVGGRIGNITKDDDIALQFWEKLTQVAPNDPEAALQAARIRLRRHQYAEALDWARQAIEVNQDGEEPLQIAVRAARELGWPEDCDKFLARLFLVDREKAAKTASSLWATLGPEAAARMLAVLQKQFPKDEEITGIANEACAQWLVAGMDQELASRDLSAAIRRLRPSDADAQRSIDRLVRSSVVAMRDAFNNRDFVGAIEHGVMASRIDPDCLEAWQTVGRAQFSVGNMPAAVDAFRRCADLNSKDARTWLTYGLALNQSSGRVAALTAFQNARRYATDAEPQREIDASMAALFPALVRDAHEAAAKDNVEGAWDCHDAAARLRPNDIAVDQLRQQLLRKTLKQIRDLWSTQSTEAASACRLYLKKSPGDTYVQTVLARTLMKTRSYSEALPIWESLSARSPADGSLHLQIARCCRSLKLVDSGIGASQEALRLDPGLQEAVEIVEYLRGVQG